MLITNLLGRYVLENEYTDSGEIVGITDSGNGETLLILCPPGYIEYCPIAEALFDMSK
jgi:hypothetical protein